MKNIFKKITRFRFSEAYTPWLILAACILAYGLMIPWIGFYWDDLPFTWIYHTFGSAGLAKYFATKRPARSDLSDNNADNRDNPLEMAGFRPFLEMDQCCDSLGISAIGLAE